ncbi:MAG: hypothetical protein ACI4JM_12950 [Oscillospiraceae bacterium]
MEKLFVYSYLWQLDLDDGKKYNDYLDILFLNETSNDLLFELEILTDSESAFMRIKRYFEYETNKFNTIVFGKLLFRELSDVYYSETISIDLFATKCYELFKILPSSIDQYEQPFNALSYIDDMVQFNSISEVRKEIEKMITFYER